MCPALEDLTIYSKWESPLFIAVFHDSSEFMSSNKTLDFLCRTELVLIGFHFDRDLI